MSSPGTRYLSRLKDGRSVWLDGKQVEDVINHPAFSGAVHTIVDLLNLQDAGKTKDILTYKDFATGKNVNMAFLLPYERKDIKRRSEAFRCWSEATFGVMSRISEFYRSQLTGWYIQRNCIADLVPDYANKISNYYHKVKDEDLLLTAAGYDPQIDRSKLASELGDLYTALRTVKKTKEGIIVRGAKMIATSGPYVDEIMVSPHTMRTEQDRPYATMFSIPVDTEGLHLICRESFASDRKEDHPLSSRYDEMDAVLVFDDVFVPWERVFIHENPEAIWAIRRDIVVTALSLHQIIVRLLVKIEFVAAVGIDLAASIGVTKFTHVQAKLGELLGQIEVVRALLLASEDQSTLHVSGVWLPAIEPLTAAKNAGTRFYPRALEILQQLSGAGMLQVPSVMAEFEGPLGASLENFYRGADRGARERVGLLKLAWDLVGSPLGSRHELYERFYAGDPVRAFAAQYLEYDKQALINKANL